MFKKLLLGLQYTIGISLFIGIIGLWILGARHTYYDHSDKAFYISLTPPGGWYWGVESFSHDSEDEEVKPDPAAAITDSSTLISEPKCNGDRYITKELADYSNDREKSTILYLHWKLQRAMLKVYRDSALYGVGQMVKCKTYDELMENANYYRVMFLTKASNAAHTKTIPELQNLYSLLYCYYSFWEGLFLSFLDVSNSEENVKNAKNKIELIVTKEDLIEKNLLIKVGEEIDRIDGIYKISKK